VNFSGAVLPALQKVSRGPRVSPEAGILGAGRGTGRADNAPPGGGGVRGVFRGVSCGSAMTEFPVRRFALPSS
jgi:hypothetical protein